MNIDFTKSDGLVPAIVQDERTGEILMVAYVNEEAWSETVETGLATFWSRSRGKLWRKGETSGHFLRVVEALTDCDRDSIVLKVLPEGPGVCHEGYRSCFFRVLNGAEWEIRGERTFDPKERYA